jgi:hypothetical protein
MNRKRSGLAIHRRAYYYFDSGSLIDGALTPPTFVVSARTPTSITVTITSVDTPTLLLYYSVYCNNVLFSTGTNPVVQITGLAANTPCDVYVVTSANRYTPAVSATSLIDGILTAPTFITSARTSTSVTVTITSVDTAITPTLLYYSVYCNNVLFSTGTTNVVPITGLAANTPCDIYVVTTADRYTPAISATSFINGILPTPTFIISARTPTSITVSITSSYVGIPTLYYSVYNNIVLFSTGTNPVVEITGLAEDTPYDIYVETTATRYTPTVSATKLDEYCTPSTPTIHETTITDTSIGIVFSNYSGLDTTNYYDVYWTSSLGSGSSLGNTTNVVTLSGLTATTSYTITGIVRDIISNLSSVASYSITKTTLRLFTGIIATPVYTSAGITANFSGTLMTTSMTISGATGSYAYANGTYNVTATTRYDLNWEYYEIFNNDNNPTRRSWYTAEGTYSSATGLYLGINKTTSPQSGDMFGDYSQIKLPYNLSLTSYKVMNVRATDYILGVASEFYLVASTNGSTWTTVDHQVLANTANAFETTFSVSPVVAYNYYRIILSKARIGSPQNSVGLQRLLLVGNVLL